MIAAEGILTSRGGKTSHAAVVARGMGKTCVCGAEELDVDTKRRRMTVGGIVVEEGDVISIDGTSGKVYLGEVPVVPSPVVEYFEGNARPGQRDDADELVEAVHRIMAHADEKRRLRVRANADTPEDAERARRFGAEGIGLCRTEHMFLGDRRKHVERLILADGDEEREEALAALLPLQREDFVGIFEAMDGLPVTVRLLDPPLHEFLPDFTELSVRVAVAEARGEDARERAAAAAGRAPAARAEPDARPARRPPRARHPRACSRCRCARSPRPPPSGRRPAATRSVEIMIPLVGAVQELELVREEAERDLRRGVRARGRRRRRT